LTKLTDAGVRSAKKPGKYYDGGGLFLLIRSSGSKSWVLRTTIQGKRRDLGLGGYPMFSLAEARAKAAEYRKVARHGLDPAALASTTLPTVREAAEKVIEIHAGKWKPGGLSEKHWRRRSRTTFGRRNGEGPCHVGRSGPAVRFGIRRHCRSGRSVRSGRCQLSSESVAIQSARAAPVATFPWSSKSRKASWPSAMRSHVRANA